MSGIVLFLPDPGAETTLFHIEEDLSRAWIAQKLSFATRCVYVRLHILKSFLSAFAGRHCRAFRIIPRSFQETAIQEPSAPPMPCKVS